MIKENWCILRTSGRKTILLADSLKRHGVEAWTPREIRKQRLPRSRAVEERTIAIMPTFVFARASHLGYLANETQNYKSPHPQFSVQLYQNRFPLIADGELRALRDAERKTIPLEKVSGYNPGDIVRIGQGGFAGLSGIVQTSDGKHTMIAFSGSKLAVKISTLLLREEYAMEDEIAA
jgi:transcription antitermination factor NusG